jgi:hypothetical protein
MPLFSLVESCAFASLWRKAGTCCRGPRRSRPDLPLGHKRMRRSRGMGPTRAVLRRQTSVRWTVGHTPAVFRWETWGRLQSDCPIWRQDSSLGHYRRCNQGSAWCRSITMNKIIAAPRGWRCLLSRHDLIVTRGCDSSHCQAGAEASCISRSTMSSSTSAKNAPTTSSISLNPSAQKSRGW